MLLKTKKQLNPSLSYTFSDIFYAAQGSDSVFQENVFWKHCSRCIAISSAAQGKKTMQTTNIFPPKQKYILFTSDDLQRVFN